jgi:hypothetical protein
MSRRTWLKAGSFAGAFALLVHGHLSAQPAAQNGPAGTLADNCDRQALAMAEAEFQRLSRPRPFGQDAATDGALRKAAADYVLEAEACYTALYGSSSTRAIDDGGLVLGPAAGHFFTRRTYRPYPT